MNDTLNWMKESPYPMLIGNKKDGSIFAELNFLKWLSDNGYRVTDTENALMTFNFYCNQNNIKISESQSSYLELLKLGLLDNYKQIVGRLVDYLIKGEKMSDTDYKFNLDLALSGKILFRSQSMKDDFIRILEKSNSKNTKFTTLVEL